MPTVIPIRPALSNIENRIAVFIPNENEWIALIRSIPQSRWSPSHGCWHFPKTKAHWTLFQKLFEPFNWNIQKDATPLSIPASEMREWRTMPLKPDYIPPQVSPTKAVLSNNNVTPKPLEYVLPTPFKIEKVMYDAQYFIGIPLADKDVEGQKMIKQIGTYTWHPQEKLWLLPYNMLTFEKLKTAFGDKLILPTSREARLIQPPLDERYLALKPEYQNKDNNPLWDALKEKQSAATIAANEGTNKDKTSLLNPQEIAKQRFASADLATLLVEHNGTLSQKSEIVAHKILVRLAEFWKGKLRLDFAYQQDWINKIKQINGHRWHKEYNCWSLPHSPLVVDILNKMFGDSLEYDLSPLANVQATPPADIRHRQSDIETPPQYAAEINRLEERMTLKHMAQTTIKLYKSCFTQFLHFYNAKHPKDITHDEIIKYMLFRIKTDKISPSVQNNFINAIKCYYEFVLGRDRTYYDLQRPKRPFQLPNVLSQNEVEKLFNAVDNIKHKCILLTIYASGLRVSEVVNLRLADIRRDDKSIFIKAGKGKKDRYTMLSETLIAELDIYLKHYTPSYWLFEGQTGGQYAVRSVQNILRDAVEKSGVNPYATVHTLRHSFATHLTLSGIDTIALQKLLGHENPKTTEIYVHLSHQHIKQIQSPLDRLKF